MLELLVVIAIIGLLSTVAVTALGNARMKARDTKRIADLKQLELALDLNYDKHGSYTQPEAFWMDCSTGSGINNICGITADWDVNSDLQDLITDGFMVTLPKDPINNATYRYTYEPWNAGQGGYTQAGQAYDLCAPLEAGGNFCINKR